MRAYIRYELKHQQESERGESKKDAVNLIYSIVVFSDWLSLHVIPFI